VAASELAPLSTVFDGYAYTISFDILPGPVTGTGVPANTQTIIQPVLVDGEVAFLDVFTPEYAPGTSKLFIGMSWSAREVPAPSVIGLLGAGLMAFGWAGRRRRANEA
jgi:hypothetical protein